MGGDALDVALPLNGAFDAAKVNNLLHALDTTLAHKAKSTACQKCTCPVDSETHRRPLPGAGLPAGNHVPAAGCQRHLAVGCHQPDVNRERHSTLRPVQPGQPAGHGYAVCAGAHPSQVSGLTNQAALDCRVTMASLGAACCTGWDQHLLMVQAPLALPWPCSPPSPPAPPRRPPSLPAPSPRQSPPGGVEGAAPGSPSPDVPAPSSPPPGSSNDTQVSMCLGALGPLGGSKRSAVVALRGVSGFNLHLLFLLQVTVTVPQLTFTARLTAYSPDTFGATAQQQYIAALQAASPDGAFCCTVEASFAWCKTVVLLVNPRLMWPSSALLSLHVQLACW